MSRHLDASRFPRTAAYLDALADDLAAHPDALGRADIYADIKENHPKLLDESSLSDELRRELERDWPEDGWIPDVIGVTLLCMARDRLCQSDDEFSKWNAERLSSIFRTRWYRALMYVMSPTLVFMGTSKRWGAMHRASEFTSKGNAKACEGRLTFPRFCFPKPSCSRCAAGSSSR